MFSVAVAGHVCADLIPELSAGTEVLPGQLLDIGPLVISPGGCVSNTGGTLVDLGARVTISSSVGDDYLGGIVRRLLQERGLDPLGLSVEAGTTTSYSIVVEKPEMNRSFWHHVGANAVFDGSSVVLEGSDVLHIGYPPLLPALSAEGGANLVALLTRARALGVTTSLDMAVVDQASVAGSVDWRQFLAAVLPLTDVFSPSIDDLISALGLSETTDPAELAQELVDLGAAIVVLSTGSGGLFLRAAAADRLECGGAVVTPLASRWADAQVWSPAAPVERVVTTNGAGDAASAGLLHALASGMDPDAALAHAAAVAATLIRGHKISSLIGSDG